MIIRVGQLLCTVCKCIWRALVAVFAGIMATVSSPVPIEYGPAEDVAEVLAKLSAFPWRYDHDAGGFLLDANGVIICRLTGRETAALNGPFMATAGNAHVAMRAALKAIKLRIHFIDHPNEPKDWSTEIRLLEKALALTAEI